MKNKILFIIFLINFVTCSSLQKNSTENNSSSTIVPNVSWSESSIATVPVSKDEVSSPTPPQLPSSTNSDSISVVEGSVEKVTETPTIKSDEVLSESIEPNVSKAASNVSAEESATTFPAIAPESEIATEPPSVLSSESSSVTVPVSEDRVSTEPHMPSLLNAGNISAVEETTEKITETPTVKLDEVSKENIETEVPNVASNVSTEDIPTTVIVTATIEKIVPSSESSSSKMPRIEDDVSTEPPHLEPQAKLSANSGNISAVEETAEKITETATVESKENVEAEVSKAASDVPAEETATVFAIATESEIQTEPPSVPTFKLMSPDAIRPPLSVGIVSSYNPSHGLNFDEGDIVTTTESVVFEPAIDVKEAVPLVPTFDTLPKEELPVAPVDSVIDSEPKVDIDEKPVNEHDHQDGHKHDDHHDHDQGHNYGHGHDDEQQENHLATSSSSTTAVPELASSWSPPTLKNMERKRKGKIDDGQSYFGHGQGHRRPMQPVLSSNDLDNSGDGNLESLSLHDTNSNERSPGENDLNFDFETLIKNKSYHLLPIFLPFIVILIIILSVKSINKVMMMKRSADITRVSSLASDKKARKGSKTLNGSTNKGYINGDSVISLSPSTDNESDTGLKSITVINDLDMLSVSDKTAMTNCSKL